MKFIFTLITVLVTFNAFAYGDPVCKVSTEDAGGFYDGYPGNVKIISKRVLDRVESNGDPVKNFKISEHDALSCDSCIITTKSSMISSFTVYVCMEARIEMCDRLLNQPQALRCSSETTALQKKQCKNWNDRNERFNNMLAQADLLDTSNGKCKLIQKLYDKEHAAK